VKGYRSRFDEGLGVGLALVRALTTLHGGEVGVVSRQGIGSTFWVRLRRGSAHLPPERVTRTGRASAPDDAHVRGYVEDALQWSRDSDSAFEGHNMALVRPQESAEAKPGPRPRVLWVNHGADMRNYVSRLLGGTYDVQALAEGEKTIDAALAAPPDIIVLGALQPGSEPLGLLAQLRRTERTALTPVILLLARASEDSALEYLDAGADDYLIKPFSSKALLARVRSSLALAKLRKDYTDRLAEANKELEAFSYSVSHDLRAPLRSIDGFSKALLNDYSDKLDENGRRYIERVRSATQRMSQLIDDLLSLSSIIRTTMTRERVNLTDLSREVLSELAAREPERKVEVQIADGLACDGDPRLLALLLENLLGNAWKFTSKQPEACVEVGREAGDGTPVFFVRDNGAGFDMEYANKLFIPFQRLHGADAFPGTGIGLATVHRVISRHGGRIWAQASTGRGATFFFTLEEAPA
ncbi:MAG TPA: ATP-binding protein, partial [Polyangiaceae bacterium]|nr:ATP-binding protein [Polyangiaceae bacterium]